jgi:hypothetical protein
VEVFVSVEASGIYFLGVDGADLQEGNFILELVITP